jgi:hypothetical protein
MLKIINIFRWLYDFRGSQVDTPVLLFFGGTRAYWKFGGDACDVSF